MQGESVGRRTLGKKTHNNKPMKLNNQRKKTQQPNKRGISFGLWGQGDKENGLTTLIAQLGHYLQHMWESTAFHSPSPHSYVALPGQGPRNTLTLKQGEVYQGVGMTSTLMQNGMCFAPSSPTPWSSVSSYQNLSSPLTDCLCRKNDPRPRFLQYLEIRSHLRKQSKIFFIWVPIYTHKSIHTHTNMFLCIPGFMKGLLLL